ncbi:ATP-dependent helicase [Mesorhizobium sp. M0571]|uniref:ATP-dependent helicase n=1 Tax=Mesorhizobium sp. M0571 TaxID=2956960 RepID=UPI00333A83D0
MENFSLIRLAANELREAIDHGMAELQAGAVVERALAKRALKLEELPAGDATLAGCLGVFFRKYSHVFVQEDLEPSTKLEVIAHEIGHEVVHDGDVAMVRKDYGSPGPGDPVLRVEAYGVKERREAQANVFARELLLPRALARRLFLGGMRARAIAEQTGLNLALVFQQLTDALLLPEPRPPAPARPDKFKNLDDSQKYAAGFRGKALLLEAGPGTGKTRTLVERIVQLIQSTEAAPSEILALTFSNKAAGELLDRVGKAVGSPAANIWTSTFHAFGLELLRKHHILFDLSQDPPLVDGSRAIDMLEEALPALPIVHHQNLFEPALALREILKAIYRAKDELVGWQAYTDLAEAMARRADQKDEPAVIAAAKAKEVALVYRHYQERLQELKQVDYGDLIMMPALRLRDDADFRAKLQAQHRWIHVDEYQDINRASAVLIKGLAGDGRQLWVVGDARQSIYRFRGASVRNMARFGEDYPDHEKAPLRVNYRSTTRIIDTFTGFSRTMKVSDFSLPLNLDPDQEELGETPSLSVASDVDDEYSRLAASIRELEKAGKPLRTQAVLARSNGTLARVGEELEARNIPVLYLGPLFDRPEVRDLLSLLSLLASSGSTLMRVAGFQQYSVSTSDVVKVLSAAKALEIRTIAMLARLEEVVGLSAQGRAGLALIATHLSGLTEGSTPWFVLMEYLFERSNYVVGLLQGNTPSADMRRVAVRQLVEALRSMPKGGAGRRSPIARGLARIRHMVLLADERELRRLPDELSDVDGVHLLTVHASKGLEFEAVHLPGLKKGAFPAPNRADRCPPPDGLVVNPVEPDAHEAEEECLFFVAMSRAQAILRFYRPANSNGKNANPSTYLEKLHIGQLTTGQIARPVPKPDFTPLNEPPAPTLTARDIEDYERCPRRFYYERVVGMRGDVVESTYRAAHRCLLQVIEAARESSTPLSEDAINEIFQNAWAESGLVDHLYEQPYRDLTQTMLSSLRPLLARGLGKLAPIIVRLGATDIEVHADQVEVGCAGTILRSIRSGRPVVNRAG